MSDDPFQAIVEQAKRDVKKFVKRGTSAYAHKDFIRRIYALLGSSISQLGLRCFENVESIVEDNNAKGDVVVFLPNDASYVASACEKLKLLPKTNRMLLIMPIYGRLAQKAVEDSGLKGDVTVEEFHADLITLEKYMFLVPCPHCFRRVFVEDDIEDLTSISRALVKFEMLNGKFPIIHAFGENANRTKHIMEEMKAQISSTAFNAPQTFESIVIIDRSCDIFTPLLTQFTYGGILDENLNPPCNILQLPEAIKYERDTIVLSDNDLAFQELRGMQLEPAVDRVNQELKEIAEAKKKMVPGMDTNTFKLMRAKAERLQKIKPLLSLHLDLMGYLANKKKFDPSFPPTISYEYETTLGLILKPPPELADKPMMLDERWDEALRLYCISSVFARGLPNAVANNVRRQMLERFGIDALDDIENLARGHLFEPEIPFYKLIDRFHDLPKYEKLKDAFKLMVDPKDPNDLGSFYGGYVPLSVRLVENAINEQIYKGKKISLLADNRTPYYKPEQHSKRGLFYKAPEHDKSIVRKVMVFVIGGMTATEISMIRAMGPKFHQSSLEFYIGTTSILTGKRLINEVCPSIRKFTEAAEEAAAAEAAAAQKK
ncbi:Sec1 family protein [Tritrichomonas foetus]|uniref:Sec1 family protein n=1 Tax=Tritrichomonas foetus TaxID=1144522 RepID=A0A1J4K4F8_9EUKA|nr:Sec1 family protein [Tritrichomonas foetus]|eukprot:OHT06075.1 Sec1 family protein [Tritrichomonas foetus]